MTDPLKQSVPGRTRKAQASRGGGANDGAGGRKAATGEDAPTLSGTHPFLARLARYAPLPAADVDGVRNAIERVLAVPRKRDIVLEGYRCVTLHLVEHGFGIRYKLLPNGKRQILGLVLAGDIVGLPSAAFNRAIYSVASLTPMSLHAIPLKAFVGLCQTRPAVAMAMLWLREREQAYVADHLIDIGRRAPLERVAHFILETYARLRAVGRAAGNAFELPVSQEVIGDILGLSAPHVNRMFRRLKEMNLVTVRDRLVAIENPGELRFLARYEPRITGRVPRDGHSPCAARR